MDEFVEPHVRRLVAEHLGVGVEELVSEVSLRDDLAADSLDMIELALALEGEFAIVVPERIVDEVRTFGDLVSATGLLIRARCDWQAGGAETAPRVSARIVPAARESGILERTGWLTPYTAETIREDALRAGPGAGLEITIAASTAKDFVTAQRRFAGLDAQGILVTVQREVGPASQPVVIADEGEARPALVAGLTDPLLDQLTGTRTAVMVTGYAGHDPWQADDLIGRKGHGAKRFGDGTPAEQGEALTGDGPCQFVERDPGGGEYRATDGHHVHAHFDRCSAQRIRAVGDFIEETPTRLEIGSGVARNTRYYQSACCAALGGKGELLRWREAAYYSRDRGERVFDIASSATTPAATPEPENRFRGLRAKFDLSVPSPNAFRPYAATLDRAAAEDMCTLVIDVCARVAGEDRLARVKLRGGARPTMDVRVSTAMATLER